MAPRGVVEAGSELFGRALEQFVAQELRAFLAYRRLDLELRYWRSTARHEVDFVIGNEIALEVKATERLGPMRLGGLRALAEERLVRRLVAVSRDPLRRNEAGIELWPIEQFLVALGGRVPVTRRPEPRCISGRKAGKVRLPGFAFEASFTHLSATP